MPELVFSEEMGEYFKQLADENEVCYDIARKARRLGRDPETKVEVPKAEDLASRVEKLLEDYNVKGIAETIRELTDKYKNRELVSLYVAREMAKRDMGSKEKSLDTAIRAGLAVLTEGILVAPLEGLADTKIGINDDGTEYVDLVFAGPIRAAGGTAQAMSVLLADVVRTEIGIGEYKPTQAEVDRFIEEIPLYKMCQHIQYSPSAEEIQLIVGRCPIMIDGEGTEKMELSGFRDLPRIKTNQVRGGACLVVAEGMCQKASKLQKHVKKLGLKGWEFMDEYLSMKGAAVATDSGPRSVHPSEKYLKDIVAGRPIFGHPSRVGGFRLRYGRARTAGLASLAFCPASMYIMDEFPALGTQLKIERPGKACVVTPCDELDGPIAVLNNGDLIQCQTSQEAIAARSDVFEITDNGEVLVPFGEFSENNHFLVPSGYPIEWHMQEMEDALKPLPKDWTPRSGITVTEEIIGSAERLKMRLLKEGGCKDGRITLSICKDTDTLRAIGADFTLKDGDIIVSRESVDTILLDLMIVRDGEELIQLEWAPPEPLLDWGALGEIHRSDIRGRLLIGSMAYIDEKVITIKKDKSVLETIGVGFKEDENKLTIDDGSLNKLLSDLSLKIEDGRIVESDAERTSELGWKFMGVATRKKWASMILEGRELSYNNGTLSFPEEFSPQLDLIGMEYISLDGRLRLSVNNTVTLLSDIKIKFDDSESRLVEFEDKPPEPVLKWKKAGKAKDEWAKRIMSGKDIAFVSDEIVIPSDTERALTSLNIPYEIVGGDISLRYEDVDALLEDIGLYRYKKWIKQTLPEDWEHPTYSRAKEMSHELDIPLHPDYNLFWSDVPLDSLKALREFILRNGRMEDDVLVVPINEDTVILSKMGVVFSYHAGNIRMDTENTKAFLSDLGLTYDVDKDAVLEVEPGETRFDWTQMPENERSIIRTSLLNDNETGYHIRNKLVVFPCTGHKNTLETLAALHTVRNGMVRIDTRYSLPLLEGLGIRCTDTGLESSSEFDGETTLEAVSSALGIEVRARAITRIGMRMGRPEKAKDRKGAPIQHGIFATTNKYNTKKDIIATVDDIKRVSSNNKRSAMITPVFGRRVCPACGLPTFRTWCRSCNAHTTADKMEGVRDPMEVDLCKELDDAIEMLGIRRPPEVKVVEALISKAKVPEPIEKAILRQHYDLGVYKDGTIRFDMSDIPLTHFRPREISMSIEQAHALGYVHDMDGDPLTDPEQMCEIKVQDVIPNRECGKYLVQIAKFIDHLLEKFYGLPRFYNVEKPEDLIGHLVIGLAPHTSGGILCRIIGYSDASGCYAHPFFHASKRRNCDGDEDCLMLLLDGLLNFSRAYLPDRRGGSMDTPLVLTTRLDPNEIDKEAQNVDCLRRYPKAFYEAAMEMKDAKDVEKMMDLIAGRIGTIYQYEGLGFTLNTKDINEGPKHSAYTTLETMRDKMDGQLSLGKKIRAVDEKDVAIRVIDKHFMPDMIGNLRSYSAQAVRCTKCGTKYRRIPLTGKCLCGNELTLTVHEASVRKYLEVSKNICEKYKLPEYTKERIMILELSMNSLFNSDKVKKCTLSDFF